MRARVAVASALLVVFAPSVAHAEEEEQKLPDATMAMLSFLGLAPLFAGAKSSFHLGVSAPVSDFTTTSMFKGVPGAPDRARSKAWALGPGFVSNGKYATVATTVSLQFGTSDDQGNGVSLDRTFAVKILYHGGVNVLGLFGLEAAEKGRVALGVGPAVSPVFGPKYTLNVPGGSLSWANFRTELAPSVSFTVIGEQLTFAAFAGWGPGSRLFVPLSFGGGEGTGTLSSFKWGNDAAANTADVKAAFETFKPNGTLFGVAMASIGFPSGSEPFLTLGARVEFRRTEFEARSGTPVWTTRFDDQEIRGFLGIGIGAPEGYSWTKGR